MGPYHEDGRYLSGDGTDDTTVIPSGYKRTHTLRGGTKGGFRKIQTTTLT